MIPRELDHRYLPDVYVHRVMRELVVQVALKDLDYDWKSLKRLRKRKDRVMAEAEKIIEKLGSRIKARRARNEAAVDRRIASRRARHQRLSGPGAPIAAREE